MLVLLVSTAPLAAAQDASRIAAVLPRVRSTTERLAALIDEASTRSPTFRDLVVSIERTDGIVYVDEGRCSRGVPACLTWQLTPAAGYRILFAVIDTRRPALDLMASIGHELRHALEVLEDPSVRTSAAVKRFYMRYAVVGSHVIETAPARAAGEAVRYEIERSRVQEQTPIQRSRKF